MQYWELFLIAGVIFIIIEMFTPVLFFFNLALAGFITAIFACFIRDLTVLIPIFVAMSAVLLLFLRPILLRQKNSTEKTGIEEKYIGKIATVITDITKNSGAVTIYNERWEARTLNDKTIPLGSEVKILKNESIVLYVEKI